MRTYRFVSDTDAAPADAWNLVQFLESVQDVFRFEIHPDPMPTDGVELDGRGLASALTERVQRFGDGHFPGTCPVLLTRRHLDEDVYAFFDERAAVISTSYLAEGLVRHSFRRYVINVIADLVLGSFVDLPIHEPDRGCISDECADAIGITRALDTLDFCESCEHLISAAMTWHRVSPRVVAAVRRMLDATADRRRCFVLMPFRRQFHRVFGTLKAAVEATPGWTCRRADEILRASDVMNVVFEEILRSDTLVADLTGQNPNVFYELGYAHAANKNVILVTQALDDVPFDLRQKQLVEYRPTPNGLKALGQRIEQYLQGTRSGVAMRGRPE